jgi:hypothetical protein
MPIDTHLPQPATEKKGGIFLPHFFLSDLMPSLKDTEFKVLLVVFARTLGFVAENGVSRKTRAWLTHNFLKAKTGRSTQAVVSAVDALIRQNLILVHLEDGTLVLTPSERRRARSKLYYSLSPYLLNRVREADPKMGTKPAAPFLENGIRKGERIKQKRELNSVTKEALFVHTHQAARKSGWNQVSSISSRIRGKEAA